MSQPANKILPDDNWRKVRDWFDHCRDLSPSEQEHFLALHERTHPGEVAEVRSLLGTAQSEGSAPKLLKGPPPEAGPNEYEMAEPLGSGGMAEVFVARWNSPGGQRLVAAKVIHSQFMADQDFLELFRFEVQLNRILRHPNIVRMYDFRSWRGRYLMALEYVPGKTLWELVLASQKGTLLPFPAAAYLFSEIAKGLVYAHSLKDPATGEHLGIIHRDVTPKNIFLGFDGSVRLLDFGIAKAKTRLRITGPGMVRGTLPYLSPEQLRGKEAVQASDLFCLAAVFVESLTGVPFNSTDYLNKSASNPLSLMDPDVPTDLLPLLKKALSPRIEDRFESVAQMLWHMRPIFTESLLQEGRGVLVKTLGRAFPEKRPTVQSPAAPKAVSAPRPAPRPMRLAEETHPAERAEKKRVSFPYKAVALGLGILWLLSFAVYLNGFFVIPEGVPAATTKGQLPVYAIETGGATCLVEISSRPTAAQVRVNRSLATGITPTMLSLPCQRTTLITLQQRTGATAHFSVHPSRPLQEERLEIPASALLRGLTWFQTFLDFHRRLLP